MADSTIRVGIVGAGNNTRLMHIPGLQDMEGVEVVSVSNRSRESNESVAKEFGNGLQVPGKDRQVIDAHGRALIRPHPDVSS